uniref:Uncharacterized protein n=2 Tax=Strongyloides stercoralis TaxID=6248 RepID=A0AAF5DDV5_STRER
FLKAGVVLINVIKNQLLKSRYIWYQKYINLVDLFVINKKNGFRLVIGLDDSKKKIFFMKLLNKKCFKKSSIMKIFYHIPLFSCIICSRKVPKCDECKMDKIVSTTLAIKNHHNEYDHLRFIPSNKISTCKKSKISVETSFCSQSIQFLDDDILDHANYLTHPICLFY